MHEPCDYSKRFMNARNLTYHCAMENVGLCHTSAVTEHRDGDLVTSSGTNFFPANHFSWREHVNSIKLLQSSSYDMSTEEVRM
jgi:hypothetical protein